MVLDKKAYNREYHRLHKQERNEYHKQYYHNNKKYFEDYFQTHKQEKREYQRGYEAIHGERMQEWRKIWRRGKYICFKDERVRVYFLVRTGQCSRCGEKRKTVMHHAKGYYRIFPWFGIEELCRSCHIKEHRVNRWVKRET